MYRINWTLQTLVANSSFVFKLGLQEVSDAERNLTLTALYDAALCETFMKLRHISLSAYI